MTDLHQPSPVAEPPRRDRAEAPPHAGDAGPAGSAATGDLAEGARRAARELAQAGREEARSYVEEHRFAAADRIRGLAEALRSTARDPEGGDGPSSRLARGAAERAERLAALLRERDADSLLSDARALSLRSPAVLVGGALTAGLLLGRLLKGSVALEHGEDDTPTATEPGVPRPERTGRAG